MSQAATQAPVRYMQGVAVPAESVRPAEFFARTRRHTTTEKTTGFAGIGGQDTVELRKADIIGGIYLRFSGNLVITLPTGTAATTNRWPYDLARKIRFTANGQSNIIQASGLKLKVRDLMKRTDLTDRGVSQSFNGATKTQGTLSGSAESWGVGSGATAIAANTYPVELVWYIPVAEDDIDLAGAIFAASSSTDLTLTIDWASAADLFVLTGGATATVTGNFTVESIKYSIPIGTDGNIVVPDLSLFHSIIEARTTGLQQGDNETRLVGQGAGKSLLRCFYQLWNGATPTPLPMTATNFGKQAWRYAGNETPDEYLDGSILREVNERQFNTDIGGLWGFGCHDFANENAFRDAVDMGTTSELRLVNNVTANVTPNNLALEYVMETVFQAGSGA